MADATLPDPIPPELASRAADSELAALTRADPESHP